MKAYDLALAVFLFSALLTFVTDIGLFGPVAFTNDGNLSVNYLNSSATKIENSVNQSDSGLWTTITELGWSAKMLISSLFIVFDIMIKSTIGLPLLLNQIGMPHEVTVLFTGLAWLIYLFGLVQFTTGKNVETREY